MRTTVGVLAFSLVSTVALAQQPGIKLGDVPGSDGNWQYGETVVDAPAPVVQRWFTEAALWSRRFPDTQWAQPLGTDAQGRQVVRFRSRVIGRPLTLHLTERPGLVAYTGEGKGVTTQGKIFISALGPQRTRVIMQSTSEVHGAAGIFASKKMRHDRALKKFRADLSAVQQLSNQWAAAQRRRG